MPLGPCHSVRSTGLQIQRGLKVYKCTADGREHRASTPGTNYYSPYFDHTGNIAQSIAQLFVPPLAQGPSGSFSAKEGISWHAQFQRPREKSQQLF